MEPKEVVLRFEYLSNPENLEGMKRFGIVPKKGYGVPIPEIRKIAKEIGTDHELARELWVSEIHDCKLLASMIEDPELITPSQMDKWVADFYSWDLCDQCCSNLFRHTNYAYSKPFEWSEREEEFIKRAAFSLIASLASGDQNASDDEMIGFFPLIERESPDERNYVKKAVNWALRQIGKRNANLNRKAVDLAIELHTMNSKSARWIAKGALKELESDGVKKRFKRSP